MARTTLSERFDANKGDTLQHEGETVRQLYRRKLDDGERFKVELRPRPDAEAVQALNLDADGDGAFVVDDERVAKLVIRADTAPRRSELQVAGGRAELTVYNAWIGSHDELHAWIGNSGMVVGDEGDTVTLRCSDGHGDVRFDDLVVVLRFGAARR